MVPPQRERVLLYLHGRARLVVYNSNFKWYLHGKSASSCLEFEFQMVPRQRRRCCCTSAARACLVAHNLNFKWYLDRKSASCCTSSRRITSASYYCGKTICLRMCVPSRQEQVYLMALPRCGLVALTFLFKLTWQSAQ